ncbi:MAG: hypothetical protein AAFO85_20780, partial [Cyanobacteria bacterium J06598_4]
MATGLTVQNDGAIAINDAEISFIPEAAMTISTGQIDVAGYTGGTVNLTGSKVGVLSGVIDASGIDGGVSVRVGGDFQGGGS